MNYETYLDPAKTCNDAFAAAREKYFAATVDFEAELKRQREAFDAACAVYAAACDAIDIAEAKFFTNCAPARVVFDAEIAAAREALDAAIAG